MALWEFDTLQKKPHWPNLASEQKQPTYYSRLLFNYKLFMYETGKTQYAVDCTENYYSSESNE